MAASPVLRRLCLLALLTSLTSCTAWHARSAPPAEAVSGKPRLVRIVRTDHSTLVLRDPLVRNDSLVGWADAAGGNLAVQVGVPLVEVARVDVRRTDALRTTGAVLGGGLVLVSAVTLAALISLLSAWN